MCKPANIDRFAHMTSGSQRILPIDIIIELLTLKQSLSAYPKNQSELVLHGKLNELVSA